LTVPAPGDGAVATPTPLVSVVLATRDRPRFLPLALACYQHQTYRRRELIVIDDGEEFPVDARSVEAVGGRLIRSHPGTSLGVKLNEGLQLARGVLCHKMDDDDWYGSRFLEILVTSVLGRQATVCRPTVGFLSGYLFFDLARWEIRRAEANSAPGGTFLFAWEDWAHRPFRALSKDEDAWFLIDQTRSGAAAVRVHAPETFLVVRHAGVDRGHTWTHQSATTKVEDDLRQRPLYHRRPEDLLPLWAVTAYRALQRDSVAAR
jgi:glycosyltransferase involved in cell wall biosynthesis